MRRRAPVVQAAPSARLAAMTRWAIATAALVGCLAACLVTSTARAQPEDWQVMWDRGVALRAEGDDLGALAVFQEALRLGGGPRVLVQVALAEQALGRWGAAGTHLEEALAQPDEWIERNRAVITSARAEIATHTGRLEVRVDVADAEIEVGDRRVGASPLEAPVIVAAGSVEVSVRAGGETETRTVEVGVGAVERVTFTLRLAEPEVVPAELDPPDDEPEVAPSMGEEGFTIVPAAIAWALAGAGAVALVVSGVVALDLDASIADDCGENRGRTCGEADVADLRTATTVADVALGVAAIAGAAALVLTIVSATSGSEAPEVAVLPFGSPSAAGVVVSSAF